MSCPPSSRIAAAASGEDADAAVHAELCLRCAAVLVDQRRVVELARRWPAQPPMFAPTRDQLAAEVMARAVAPAHRARWSATFAIGATGLAAAAIAIISVRRGDPIDVAPPPPRVTIASPPAPSPAPSPAPRVEPAPEAPRPEHVMLHDGKLAIDTRGRGPIEVIRDGVTVAVASGRAELSSRRGVIVAVRVFAGSVEIDDRSKPIVIVAGDTWVQPQPTSHSQAMPSTPAEPAEPAVSLARFRAGWQALHADRDGDALAAFDRATDPIIREEALFWAAVAADRAGDRDGAAHRLRTFLDEYPASPRADDARSLLDQLTP